MFPKSAFYVSHVRCENLACVLKGIFVHCVYGSQLGTLNQKMEGR